MAIPYQPVCWLQTPAILKPLELWTGKQVISVLIRPNLACSVFINIELKEKFYTSGEHLCAKDGYVCIINSELVSGRIGKGLLGGSKGGLFGVMTARYSPAVAGALFFCPLCP
jgi:DNA-directed RNA polymerase III subunit RPC1